MKDAIKAALTIIVGGFVFAYCGHLLKPKTEASVTPICAPETTVDTQQWLYRGLLLCESTCGSGVPFDVEVQPERVRCNCGRPAKLPPRIAP